MKRKIVAIAIAFAALGAGAALDPGGWNQETRARLDALIERNRGNPDAYAVFDFDYTTAIGDLSYLCMWRTFETMGLCFDGLAERLAKGIPPQFQDEARAVAALARSAKKAASAFAKGGCASRSRSADARAAAKEVGMRSIVAAAVVFICRPL